MNKEFLNKAEQLLGGSSPRELLFKDYAGIDTADWGTKFNLRNARGSVRLVNGFIVTPDDVQRMRNRVSHYRYKSSL